jgi:hypothetical protein
MKREIAFYIARCDVCQRVKAEHQKPVGLLQPLKVPMQKWEEVGIDFIIGLPKSKRGHDSIWVIIDRLTKVAHFLRVKTTHKGRDLAELYTAWIVSIHGVPKVIVSDRGTQFTSRFWTKLHEALGTKLSFSTTYHPQTGGQTERVNQVSMNVSYHMGPSGKISFHLPSSPTTITIKPVCRWPPLKPYMAVSDVPLSTGPRSERAKCLDLISLRKLKSRSNSSAIV